MQADTTGFVVQLVFLEAQRGFRYGGVVLDHLASPSARDRCDILIGRQFLDCMSVERHLQIDIYVVGKGIALTVSNRELIWT